jgi:SecD/SecF fusion protein
MQSKSAIQAFTVLLTLACIYQLSFTWVVKVEEQKAIDYAEGNINKETYYLDSIKNVDVYDLLINQYTYGECKEREINLGLDLKGGMNVTLEVSVIDVIKSLAVDKEDTVLLNTIARASELQEQSQDPYVTLFGQAFQQLQPNGNLAYFFSSRENKGEIDFNTTDEEAMAFLKKKTDEAIDGAFEVISARIDKFGVSQPKIVPLETKGRILIELPGVKDPARAKKILQSTAKLEFWVCYNNREVYNQLFVPIDKKLAAIQEAEAKLAEPDSVEESTEVEELFTVVEPDSNSVPDSSLVTSVDSPETGLSNDLLKLLDSAGGDSAAQQQLSIEEYRRQSPLLSRLQVVTDIDENNQQRILADAPFIGIALVRDTAEINTLLNRDDIQAMLPKDFKYLWMKNASEQNEDAIYMVGIRTNMDGSAPLEGDVITEAVQDVDPTNNQIEVRLAMDDIGTKIWKNLTRVNSGGFIAIALDDQVYSAPRINGEIPYGRTSITGFDLKQAIDVANVLNAGKLPAPARIVEEAIVGPSLGQEAIDAGLSSFLLALIVVLLYMIFYYNKAGMVASVALLSNIFFIMGVLASLGAVLTLPGIAGIVLTIGMSIDANVLIFERVREEIRGGKGMGLAITDGYKNAYTSIIDANVTTLLVGLILLYFGSGPIKGFATTLIIGIVTSLFSAIFITRLIFITFLKRKKDISFSNKITESAFTNLNIQFLAKRKLFYGISAIIILGGLASLFTRGLNYGVDFTGGRSYVVRFDDMAPATDVKTALTGAFESAPEVKTFGGDNQLKITTKYLINNTDTSSDRKVENALKSGLADYPGFDIMSSQKVGPTIADDIKVGAVKSTIFGLLIVFLYILMRFRKWQFGLGALAALFHDVVIVLSCFSIFYGFLPFSLEMDQAFIAALLTVIGYSINDTVVVFDRIREFLGLYPKRDTGEVMNMAINSTLSRTFNTSISTFAVLLVIFILGGEVIRGFSFALLLGVVVGTYSSICIATPVALDTYKKLSQQGKKK